MSQHMFSASLADSDITRCSGYVSNVPFADVRPELLGEAIGFELAFRHDYRPQIYRAEPRG